MKILVAISMLAASLLAVAGPTAAAGGVLKLETVAQVPLIGGESVEVRAISGDYAVMSSFPWTSVHRLNFRTGEVKTHSYSGGIFARDLSDAGHILFSHRDENVNPGRFVWNPDADTIERFDYDSRFDQDRFDEAGGLTVPAAARGTQNVSGTLEHTSDRKRVRLPGGNYQAAPEGSVMTIARDKPVAFVFDTAIDQYGFEVVSQVARWDVASGSFDVFAFNINADRGETRTLGLSALNPTGNLAVWTTTDGQTIVRLVTETNTVQSATTVEGIVDAADFDPGAHAEVLRLYQAIFGRYPDLGGAKYWIDINNQGHNVLAIAGYMSASPEWGNTYAGTTDEEFVEIVYSNVLGRGYDQDGYNYWLDLVKGTNTYGNNAARAKLLRPEMVFYVTANNEFTSAYPFQP